MSVNVSKSDGETTFTFEVVQTSANLDPRISSWAEYVWGHGYHVEVDDEKVEWDDATNTQKMNALNKRIKALGRAEANTMESIKAKEIADEEKVVYDELEEL